MFGFRFASIFNIVVLVSKLGKRICDSIEISFMGSSFPFIRNPQVKVSMIYRVRGEICLLIEIE